MAKYISGKFKNLKVGIKDYSEGKVALNVVGIISAASYQSGSSGITSTGATFHDLNVTGVSTFAGNINANGNIVGDNATNITGINNIQVNDADIANDLDIAGNIVGTNSNISGINSVTATTFYGDGSNLTGIDGVSDGDKGDVVVSAGGTIWNLDTTGVTAGSYNNANITVDAKGRLTAASSGSGGGDANYALTAGIATNVIGGIGSLTQLHVSGMATLGGLYLNGLSNLETVQVGGDLNVAGVATFMAAVYAKGLFDVEGRAELDTTNIAEDLYVAGISTFNGDVSIGGTLTYEDVTNIDSVGFITARSGLNVLGSGTTTTTLNVTGVTTLGTYTHADRIYLGSGNSTYIEESSGINLQTNASKNIVLGVNASGGSSGSIKLQKSSGSDSLVVHGHGGISIAGVTTFNDDVTTGVGSTVGIGSTVFFGSDVEAKFGDNGELRIFHDTSLGGTNYVQFKSTDTILIGAYGTNKNVNLYGTDGNNLQSNNNRLITAGGTEIIETDSTTAYLKHSGNEKLKTTSTGVVVTGVMTATSFSGDGSALTNVPGFTPDAQENLYAGTDAGKCSDTDTCHNVAIGYSAGCSNDSSGCNVFIGRGAGQNYADTCGRNVFIGCNAGQNRGDGRCNIALGPNALMGSTTCAPACNQGRSNIGLGPNAGCSITTGGCNIFMGMDAGQYVTSGENNVILGTNAGSYPSVTNDIDYSVFIGYAAGKCVKGYCNIAIGNNAMMKVCTGENNIAMGFEAGGGNGTHDSGSGSNNVSIGNAAACRITSGNGNLNMGQNTGRDLTTGSYNVFLGFGAAYDVDQGSNNIAIGCKAGCNIFADGGDNQLSIGGKDNQWINGNADFNVGIGTTNPNAAVGAGNTAKLSVGIVSAVTYYGDGSNLTGTGGETLISGITVKDEGSTVGTAGSIKNINFIGDSVTASASGSDTANITITGGAPGDAGYWVKTDAGIHTLSKVGIGTTNPLTNLDVHDEVSFASTVSIGTTIDIVPNNTAGTLSFNGSAGTLLSLSNDLTTGSIFSVADVSGFGAIDVYADRKIAMAYVSAGDSVGIGTTNPLEKLHVVGVVSATSFFGDGSGLTNLPSSGSSYWVKTDAGIHTTSKVGIGTTNPLFNLDVGSYVSNNVSTASTIRIIGENNSTAIRIGPGGTSNDITLIRVDSKDGTTDGTGNTDLGHSLKYMGSGSGADNRLAFWVDNTSNTAYEAVSIYNDGKFVVDGDPSGGGHGFHGTPTDAFTVRGTSKFTDGVCVTGVVTATAYYGSGANLTNVPGWAPDAQENLYAGTSAGASSDADTCFNIGIGYSAGNALDEGDNNILLGCNAGTSITDGAYNVAIGAGAGRNIGHCSGCDANVYIGRLTGACNRGSDNVALGCCAMRGSNTVDNNSGYRNVVLGMDAAKYLTSGTQNVIIGESAGCGCCLSGNYNVLLGPRAGEHLTTGCVNTFIGYDVGGGGIITGDENVVIGGWMAGFCLTSGTQNIFLGSCAGRCVTTGGHNIAMGRCTLGGEEVTGDHNIALGACSGKKITSGHTNVLIGRGAGCCVTTGCYNLAIGNDVQLPSATDNYQLVIGSNALGVGSSLGWINGNADFNVGIGTTNPNAAVGAGNTAKLSVGIVSAYQLYGDGSNLTGVGGTGAWTQDSKRNLYAGGNAGAPADDSCCNISLGCNAGPTSDGKCNVLIGMNAGAGITTTSGSVFIGYDAGECRGYLQDNNIAIGTRAGSGADVENSKDNIAIGNYAGYMVGGCYSVHLGVRAGFEMISGSDNISLGYCALAGSGTSTSNTGYMNIAIGCQSGRGMTSGYENILLGRMAGNSLTDSSENIAIGSCAMQGTTGSSVRNLAMGLEAGREIDGGDDNVFLGSYAGKCVTTPGCNVMIGFSAGRCVQTGQSNVFIGDTAGQGYSCLGSASQNIAIGNGALYNVQDAARNIVMGCSAGQCTTSGDHNIFLGTKAGSTNTSGSHNIAIGCGIQLPSATDTKQLAIGAGGDPICWITGDSDMNVTLSGILTAYADTGIVSATKYCGDGSALTGVGGVSGVGTFDAAAGVAHTINSYTIASETFETSEYTIFAGIGSGIQSQKILVMEDGTTAYSQEYGVMYNNDTQLVSASARIVSGDIRVEVTPETGVTGLTTYRFSRQTT